MQCCNKMLMQQARNRQNMRKQPEKSRSVHAHHVSLASVYSVPSSLFPPPCLLPFARGMLATSLPLSPRLPLPLIPISLAPSLAASDSLRSLLRQQSHPSPWFSLTLASTIAISFHSTPSWTTPSSGQRVVVVVVDILLIFWETGREKVCLHVNELQRETERNSE